MVNKAKTQQASKPKEILEADPDNILLKYSAIKSVKMSYSSFTGAKIHIKAIGEDYKYNIPDYKNYKKYVKSLQSIFGNKLKS